MSKIAVSGLGRMGMQIARKLAEAGHTVIAHNRSSNKVDAAGEFGAIKAYDKQAVTDQLAGEQAVLWLMVPAEVVETELEDWLDLLPQGSIIIDGGNTDYRRTREHARLVADHGSILLDIGTSGGIHGLKDGFCMMVGGDRAAYSVVEPFLQTLAKQQGGYQHFGTEPGAGHYVKMVHNAIEYGMMESLAEGYRMLKEGPYKDIDLATAGELWQHGSIVVSGLNKLSTEALRENPELSGIDGYVAESGEARWALETAQELGIELPAIQSAMDVRLKSQQNQTNFATKLLAAMRGKFGGHAINKENH